MKIAVVGLGKIGLPLAVQCASQGHQVLGCDLNQAVVETVNSGRPTFDGESGLAELLDEQVRMLRLTATTNTSEAVMTSEVVLVVVPLLVDNSGDPIYDSIDNAARDIGRGLQRGSLVVFETTLPVGTTRNRLIPLLEENSGLRAGVDFFVAFSPERVYSGNVLQNLADYPKLVGGLNEESTVRALSFYSQVLNFNPREDIPRPNGVWDLGSLEAAEFSKLAETTYRDVNIALANQFALFSERMGIDVYKVIEACNSQPFSHIHQPGVAVGGHCIPVYPHMYLIGDETASVVKAARAANRAMPSKIVDRLEAEAKGVSGQTVAIMGLAYRGGVKEHAFSGAWDLVAEIQNRGGRPLVHDPLYTYTELESLGLQPYTFGQECDLVIVQANHKEYLGLTLNDFPRARVMLDGRNIIRHSGIHEGKVLTVGVGLA